METELLGLVTAASDGSGGEVALGLVPAGCVAWLCPPVMTAWQPPTSTKSRLSGSVGAMQEHSPEVISILSGGALRCGAELAAASGVGLAQTSPPPLGAGVLSQLQLLLPLTTACLPQLAAPSVVSTSSAAVSRRKVKRAV
jgi:hypothetical protein